MTGALIILSVTVIAGVVLYLTHRFGENEARQFGGPVESNVKPDVCCGLHDVCEKGLSGKSAPIYFDDEELDRFAGREPETYSAEETEEFREVLYTLLSEDVYQWGLSLTERGVAMPSALRDEWIMLITDGNP